MDSLDTKFLKDAMEQIHMVLGRLLVVKRRHKSHADQIVQSLVFIEGDHGFKFHP